ncbi:MAG TPA: cyclic nucleotide-binding domain-containing protein, partial [Novosphingobium sp.]|nr:cyclic nucleotide-binding domain-containing protein [Novosphingobium sp.]
MHAAQLAELLTAQSLFADCEPDELSDILLRGHHRSFKRDQEMMAQGDEGDSMFIVLAGLARVSMVAANGREIVLDYAEPGAVLGEIAFLDGGERTASVHAIDPVEALCLSRAAFDEIVAHHQGL